MVLSGLSLDSPLVTLLRTISFDACSVPYLEVCVGEIISLGNDTQGYVQVVGLLPVMHGILLESARMALPGVLHASVNGVRVMHGHCCRRISLLWVSGPSVHA